MKIELYRAWKWKEANRPIIGTFLVIKYISWLARPDLIQFHIAFVALYSSNIQFSLIRTKFDVSRSQTRIRKNNSVLVLSNLGIVFSRTVNQVLIELFNWKSFFSQTHSPEWWNSVPKIPWLHGVPLYS